MPSDDQVRELADDQVRELVRMRDGRCTEWAQRLMRHSTPHLTAKHYQRAEGDEMRADVNRLRKPSSGE